MKFIVNYSIPTNAIHNLRKYGEVVLFSSSGITYPEISCHPDIFICQADDSIVVAPNIPATVKEKLVYHHNKIMEGKSTVGKNYPETAHYNAVVTENYLIHNLDITDEAILDLCSGKTRIHVNQAYTRCNLLPLKNDRFITSDKGIFSTLQKINIDSLYVDPSSIILPGFDHGFFGGACGICDDNIYLIGNLDNLKDGDTIRSFLEKNDYNIVELYDGKLFDGGSIIVIE